MAAMTSDRGREIGQNIQALQITGFGDGQQAGRGYLAIGAAVAKADFAPLHACAERSFGAVVSGLHALVIEKSKQSLVVLGQSRGKVADPSVGAAQMPLSQDENPLFDRDRTDRQLASI